MFGKLNINRLLVGPGGSTTKGLVERHIAPTKTAMLKLHKQCRDEGLEVSYSDICYEACMAQNQMLEYAGGTPQLALTGQHQVGHTPDSETLSQITGALESRPECIETLYRTRLLAKQAIIQSLIQERLAKAATMKQHIHQPQTLLPGTVCDIWRQPDRKDEDGWRGPAEIISIERQAGSAIVKHQGQPLIVPLHHIRKHVLQGYFHKLALDSPQQLQQAFDFCNFECIAGFS